MNNNLYQLNKILIPIKYEYPKLEKFLENTILLWGINQKNHKIEINYKNLEALNKIYRSLINSKYPTELKKRLINKFIYWHVHKQKGFTLKENKIIKKFIIKSYFYKKDNKKPKNDKDNSTINKLIKKLSNNNNNDNDNDTGPTLGKRKPKSNEPEL